MVCGTVHAFVWHVVLWGGMVAVDCENLRAKLKLNVAPGTQHLHARTELFIGKHSEKQSKANGAQQMSLAEIHLGTICFLVSMAAIAGFVLGSGFTALGFKFGKSVWLTGRVKPQAEPTTPEEEGLLASTDMDASDDYSGVPPAGSHQIL